MLISTKLCSYTLKQFIDYYIQCSTTVLAIFLEASTAFDTINYWLLFKHIFDKGFLTFVIEILTFGILIRKCITTTFSFLVSNGVK